MDSGGEGFFDGAEGSDLIHVEEIGPGRWCAATTGRFVVAEKSGAVQSAVMVNAIGCGGAAEEAMSSLLCIVKEAQSGLDALLGIAKKRMM